MAMAKSMAKILVRSWWLGVQPAQASLDLMSTVMVPLMGRIWEPSWWRGESAPDRERGRQAADHEYEPMGRRLRDQGYAPNP